MSLHVTGSYTLLLMINTRYRRILWFFGLAIAGFIWWELFLPHIGFRKIARAQRQQRLRKLAVSFRRLAVDMGGVMIKVGQFLSARLDVLPRVITDELSGLQDEVAPESFETMRQVIEREFNAPLERIFRWFDPLPMASASIGQVHRAGLLEAKDRLQPAVVVKVQRPNIELIVATDLAALKVVGGWVHRYPPVRRRVNVPALLAEFSQALYEEIDYLHEANNAELFRNNFAASPGVQIPHVLWDQTTRRVLTLEDVEAIKITDYQAIEAAGIQRSEVANRLVDMYLKQIFEDRFFHADPHPGNLFVKLRAAADENNTTRWDLIFVDFGMTGRISPEMLTGLREAVIAVGTRDAARLIKAYQVLNVLLPDADLALLEKATTLAIEQFWGRTPKEIIKLSQENVREFARQFGELLYEMPFQLPDNMILLGRCLSILNGMCTGLDPNFNFWMRLEPYARSLLAGDEHAKGWETWLQEIVGFLRVAVFLPRRIDHLIGKIEQGLIEVQIPDLRRAINRLERAQSKQALAILTAACFLAAIQLFLAGHWQFAAMLALLVVAFLLLILFR